MAGELETEEEVKDQDGDELRVLEDFEEKTYLTTVMFSVKTPRAIVEKLKSKLKEFEVDVDLHSKKWKLTYLRKSELDDNLLE
jgi:hypothetical protein